jgi:hypothetical protein
LPPKLDIEIRTAAEAALGVLKDLDDPILKAGHGAAVNAPRPAAGVVDVLIAEERGAKPGRSALSGLPSVCRVQSTPITVCETADRCSDIDPATNPLILCNVAYFRAVTRYNNDLGNTLFGPDRGKKPLTDAYMIFLSRRAQKDPDLVLKDMQDGARRTLLPLMTFFFAHELRHIQTGRNPHAGFTPSGAPSENAGASVRTLVLCRNLREFEKQGWSPFFVNLGEEGLNKDVGGTDPRSQEIYNRSLAIWKDEIDADGYATQQLTASVTRAEQASPAAGKQAHTTALFGLVTVAYESWYRRLDTFLSVNCPEIMDQSFAASRCLCRARDNYRNAWALFDETHPPMPLRMGNAIKKLIHRSGDPKKNMYGFDGLVDAVMAASGGLAYGACLVDKLEEMLPNATVFQDVPSLEGSWMQSKGLKEFEKERDRECEKRPARPSPSK